MSTGNYCKACGSVLLGDVECYLCKTKAADAEAKAVISKLHGEEDRYYGNQDAKLATGQRCSRCGQALPSNGICIACGRNNKEYGKGCSTFAIARPATEGEVLSKARALLDEARKLMEGVICRENLK